MERQALTRRSVVSNMLKASPAMLLTCSAGSSLLFSQKVKAQSSSIWQPSTSQFYFQERASVFTAQAANGIWFHSLAGTAAETWLWGFKAAMCELRDCGLDNFVRYMVSSAQPGEYNASDIVRVCYQSLSRFALAVPQDLVARLLSEAIARPETARAYLSSNSMQTFWDTLAGALEYLMASILSGNSPLNSGAPMRLAPMFLPAPPPPDQPIFAPPPSTGGPRPPIPAPQNPPSNSGKNRINPKRGMSKQEFCDAISTGLFLTAPLLYPLTNSESLILLSGEVTAEGVLAPWGTVIALTTIALSGLFVAACQENLY